MLKKDGKIRGESILKTLTPELVKIFNGAPKTGTATIKITLKDHRIIKTNHEYWKWEGEEI